MFQFGLLLSFLGGSLGLSTHLLSGSAILLFFHSWWDFFSIGFLRPAFGADVMPEACQQDVLPAVLLEATHTSVIPFA